METIIQCPSCRKRYKLPDGIVAASVKCPSCGAGIPVSPPVAQAVPLSPAAQPGAAPGPATQPGAARSAASAASQMAANRAFAGKTCTICSRTINLGQQIRNCDKCGNSYHAECWTARGGCATPNCPNAPLPQMAPAASGSAIPYAAVAAPSPGIAGAQTKRCQYCGETINARAIKCPHCNEFFGGRQAVATRTSGKAIAGMVLGIASLVVCYVGFIIAILALVFSHIGKKEIDTSGGAIGGRGMAVAGEITGLIGLIVQALILIFVIAAAAS